MAGRSGIEALLHLMEMAFGEPGAQAEESQALLQNLASVPEDAWRTLPEGGARSIESIVLHVGTCKVMYADCAFRDGTLSWSDTEVQPWPEGEAPMADAIDWLVTVHNRLVEHVQDLADDAELDPAAIDELGRPVADPLDHRRNDHARRLPRRRDQPPPKHARHR